jgi:hypothetical protein
MPHVWDLGILAYPDPVIDNPARCSTNGHRYREILPTGSLRRISTGISTVLAVRLP